MSTVEFANLLIPFLGTLPWLFSAWKNLPESSAFFYSLGPRSFSFYVITLFQSSFKFIKKCTDSTECTTMLYNFNQKYTAFSDQLQIAQDTICP